MNILNNDFLMQYTLNKLGGSCEYINSSRWMKYEISENSFYAFSTRYPIDDPRIIERHNNKIISKKILSNKGFPIVPWQVTSYNLTNKEKKYENGNWVLKPINGSKGKGVVTNLPTNILNEHLKKHPNNFFIFEPYFKGRNIRVLLLKDKVIGAYEKFPTSIQGDGQKTVKELLDDFCILNSIDISSDADINYSLRRNSINLSDVLPKNIKIIISNVVNISRGSLWKTIPIENLDFGLIKICEEVSKTSGLKLLGIDIIYTNETFYILEINPSPGLIGHSFVIEQSKVALVDLTIATAVLKEVFNFINPNCYVPDIGNLYSFNDFKRFHERKKHG